jgi:hypothetical protein
LTPVPVFPIHPRSRNLANTTATEYKSKPSLTCFVNAKDPGDILLRVSNWRARSVINAVIATLFLLGALCYAISLCFGALPTPRRSQGASGEPPLVYVGYEYAVQTPPHASENSSVQNRNLGGRSGPDSRYLTTVEASKVLAATTVRLGPDYMPRDALCVVCLEQIDSEAGDRAAVVLPCAHAFHPPCISQWLTRGNPCCPCCNFDVSRTVRGDRPPSAGHASRNGLLGADHSSHAQDVRLDEMVPSVQRAGGPGNQVESREVRASQFSPSQGAETTTQGFADAPPSRRPEGTA